MSAAAPSPPPQSSSIPHASLQEVFRLRHNQKLKSLDLRLNPVASEFPEYRLFVIHLLPLLQRLDDGDILGSERGWISSRQFTRIHKFLSKSPF